MAVITKQNAHAHLVAFRASRYQLGAKPGDETDQALVIAMAALRPDGAGLDSCPVCSSDPDCWYCLGTNIDTVKHWEIDDLAKRARGWRA